MVTDRRTLCLVGGEDEDTAIEVPHEPVVAASYHTGLFATRFVLRTPRTQYHCWAKRSTSESLLAEAAGYVEDRTAESPAEIEADDGANQLTYRGQPISRENHLGVPGEPPLDAGTTGGAEPAGDASSDGGERQNRETTDSPNQQREKPTDLPGE